MHRSLLFPSISLVAILAGCGGSSAPPPTESTFLKPSEGVKDVVSGTELERFFPLVDGMVYSYVSLNEVGEEGMLVARVHRIDKTHGELRYPRGSKQFEYRADGVAVITRDGVSYVLKSPLAVGTTWRGEHGGNTVIHDVGMKVDTPHASYTGCVRTREERGGDRPAVWATTFCPDVGVVVLEAGGKADLERATLKSYAAPLQMKPDGTEQIPVGPQPVP